MSKKKVVIKANDDGTVAPIENQPTTLAKSMVLGAQLLEVNEALTKRVAVLELAAQYDRAMVDTWQQRYERYGNELDYWKKHGRRIWGRWHVTVKVDLTPWSWSLRPQFPKRGDVKLGCVQFWWLFLCVEATEA